MSELYIIYALEIGASCNLFKAEFRATWLYVGIFGIILIFCFSLVSLNLKISELDKIFSFVSPDIFELNSHDLKLS